jgi:hypothetical protein
MAKTYVANEVGKAWVKRLELQAMTDPWKAKQMMDRAEIPGLLKVQLQETINRSAVQVGARNIASSTAPYNAGDVAGRYNYGLQKFVGLGYSKEQAMGIMNNLTHESGGRLHGGAINPGDGSDGSDSIGIGQWNSKRAVALKEFAAAQGKDWKDYDVQLDFVHQELNGSESKAGAILKSATSAADATEKFMTHYERPDAAKAGLNNRLAAGKYAGELGINGDSLAPKSFDATQTNDWIKRARAEAERQFPGQVTVADQAEMRVLQTVGRTERVAAEYRQEQFAAVQSTVQQNKPKNLDELYRSDPRMMRAYAGMSLEHQTRIDKLLENNAKELTYTWDKDNLPRYRELMGKYYTDPEAFRKELLVDEKMPGSGIKELIDLQQKRGDPTPQQQSITHAKGVLTNLNMLEYYGVPSDGPTHFKFVGALSAYLDRWRAENPRSSAAGPSDAELIKAMPELTRDIGMDKPIEKGGFFSGRKQTTQKAFEANPDSAAASAVEASRTFVRQKVEEGYAPGAVESVRQAFFDRYKKYPNSGEFDRMYDLSPGLKARFPKKSGPYIPSNQERSQ